MVNLYKPYFQSNPKVFHLSTFLSSQPNTNEENKKVFYPPTFSSFLYFLSSHFSILSLFSIISLFRPPNETDP